LGLKDAYLQIKLTEEAAALTALTVTGQVLFPFTVTPFGLYNAPSIISRPMDDLTIPPDLRHYVFGYLENLYIVSKDFASH